MWEGYDLCECVMHEEGYACGRYPVCVCHACGRVCMWEVSCVTVSCMWEDMHAGDDCMRVCHDGIHRC